MNTNRKKACKTDNREKIGASIFGVHLIVSVIIILGSQRAAYCRMSDAYYERVFIHTDREYYIAGESVRFKGYLNSGDGSLVRSRILYVEILGTEGQSIGKQAFLLDENMVAGSVHLPDSLRSGTYFLRACTNWHKNLGNRYAFMKELLIVNRFGNNGKFAEEFPHGGEIITDPAKHDSHAIKLVDSAGSYFLVFKPVLIPQSGSVHCEIYSKGRRVYHEEITSWTEGSVLQVSREELPEGLLKILLREDDREQAVGYILNAHEPIRLNIKLDREVYEQRSPVSMKLELTGDTEIFEYGSISVSVSPVPDAFPQLNGMSITDWFNIYSEIANSFDPIKFYKPDSPIITGADRNWLFDEPELENNRYPIESYGHVIRGRVVEQRSGKAVSGAVVVFSFIDTIPYFDYDKTDHSGYFYINIPLGICADPGILQVWDTPEGTGICEIKLDGEDENYGFQWTGTERIGGEELTRLFSEQIAIFEIEKIFDDPDPPVAGNCSGIELSPFYEGYAFSVYPSEFVKLNNFSEIAREILPGVKVRDEEQGILLRIMDEENNLYFENDPLVMINGLPIRNFNTIVNLNSNDIEKIDIIRKLFAVGDLIFSGVLSIKLKGNFDTEQFSTNSLCKVKNWIQTNENNPMNTEYENLNSISSRRPDFRNTLMWMPELKINETGKDIKFYTADLTGNFRVTVQGLINGTIPVSASVEFIVESK